MIKCQILRATVVKKFPVSVFLLGSICGYVGYVSVHDPDPDPGCFSLLIRPESIAIILGNGIGIGIVHGRSEAKVYHNLTLKLQPSNR